MERLKVGDWVYFNPAHNDGYVDTERGVIVELLDDRLGTVDWEMHGPQMEAMEHLLLV